LTFTSYFSIFKLDGLKNYPVGNHRMIIGFSNYCWILW